MDDLEIGWSRFSYTHTAKTDGLELYRALILSTHVNISVREGITHRQLLEQIAQQSHEPIPIQSLPETLVGKTGRRGQVVFGCPGNYFDRIASKYESMWWWISAAGLYMGVISPPPPRISPFDRLAGRLMAEGRPRRQANNRLPPKEYFNIATALDEAGFKPIAVLWAVKSIFSWKTVQRKLCSD